MRLSWQEIRVRARAFSERWQAAHYEKGETQSFYDGFFGVFGVDRKKVGIYEKRVELIDQKRRGFIDLLWPGVLLVEQKSAGRDLTAAEQQAFDYVLGLKDRDQPKWVLTCDFQRFRLLNLETRETTSFTLPELHAHVEAFAFILGVERRSFGTQAAVNIKAAELMGRLHDALEESGYKGHDLERFLVRLLFCLFADDTGIFEERDDFLYLIEEETAEDGKDVGRLLNDLFDVLDTDAPDRQQNLDRKLARFPYINGKLFGERLRTAHFNAKMRDDLITACRFDWGKVSPAIFGSLFQSVMEPAERRKKGAHYTTEPNIMKVIGPLFLDELKAELAKLLARRDGGRRAALLAFQEKLAKLEFLDPACGCGNFLVVTYRELRALELAVLNEVFSGQLEMDVEALGLLRVSQFHGIEYEEFPAYIAEVAMWMADHLANQQLGMSFGKVFARIPLKQSANIRHGDALEVDWNDVLPHERCFAVLGNPPFVGHQWRNVSQQAGMHRVWGIKGQFNQLDYVTAWFRKSVDYAVQERKIRIALVATNSITQGEQAGILWSDLFMRGVHIIFAHRTFSWFSEARGQAAVHCVIIGLSFDRPSEARLFEYPLLRGEPVESIVRRINGYLIDGPEISIPARTAAPVGLPEMHKGSQPTDGARLRLPDGSYVMRSNLILDANEREKIIEREPHLAVFLRPYLGGEELISGNLRWCFWLKNLPPDMLRSSAELRKRLERVRDGRLQSPTASVKAFADYPWLFTQDRQPSAPYIGIPEVSSIARQYIPMAILSDNIIASNKLQIIPSGTLFVFAALMSAMHMSWVRTIGGRLKSDFSYAPTLYNTFPWPDATAAQREKIEVLAQAILDARTAWPTSSLADLYDPDTMPANLRKAHAALDLAVDRLYRREPFATDRDRVEHLFGLYEKLVNPLGREAEKQNKRVARKARKAPKTGAPESSERGDAEEDGKEP